MKLGRLLLIVAGLMTLTNSLYATEPADLLAGFEQTYLSVSASDNQCIELKIYLANTDQQKAQGLMFIRKLSALEGMLFRYEQPSRITMWMKNTYVPLDLIFADVTGTITGIANNTRPLSTKRITSSDNSIWVLEVNAGSSRRWRVKPGDKIQLGRCPVENPGPTKEGLPGH